MKTLIFALCLSLCACATKPKHYAPPDSTKLHASTQRVARAVDRAHTHTKEAQVKVKEARTEANVVFEEIKKVKEAPPELVEKVQNLEISLVSAEQVIILAERSLVEADQAKAQVEKDKAEYFNNAQRLADAASRENEARIKSEKSLSWYRWHWWGSWIVFGIGVLACVVLFILKLMGKLTFL